ncbi:Pyridoxal phosphate phosphatase YigL [Vibrio sp. B1FLJ16]|uniref:Cof-type HAD-IIB family hydrolase n=1 Tax=Vibrio sp. B1FLJ16 TaxID=2751178 RepID=UPI0015F55FBA|nr:Cof-type HAD-IIB family hydrolase [Vibrio sp. B1FLJ16]CAD7813722.1 Pyridoxal phosphate phosphatase YigL [Vibrio sp. B1FLJ16]CAE6920869.1 Pyridoxal phosphate phosphatase YigL [Vibrio sp. B1FLJ16]
MSTSLPCKEITKIVASDLDGTLLAPNHQLSAYSKMTLRTLHEMGYTFIFATGRHHVDVAGIRGQVGIPAYMITSNGARVHDQEDKLTYSEDIPQHLVQGVIDTIKHDHEILIHMYQHDDWLLNKDDESLREFHDEFSYKLFDEHQAPTDGIAKIFFTHEGKDHERLAAFETKLREQFGDQLNIAFSTPWCLEVMNGEVSKGHALQAIAESLGLTLENCLAFGDGMNDVEMLSMAGKGLIMGTAHEKVMQALPDNEVIGSNAEDAVARYLQKHLLLDEQ